MNHHWKIYLKPFDGSGNYQSEWIDVSSDVDFSKMGSVSFDLDNTDYDIGIYRPSNITVTLNNLKGRYSDVGGPTSIFKYKRSNSLCKLTWEVEEDGPWCGLALTDQSYLSEEITIFTGLINDESLTMEVIDQKITFPVLGLESIFQKVIVPYSLLSSGNTASEIIFKCLNQPLITSLISVLNSNINLGINQSLDVISNFENKTVQEALNDLLFSSNSVLFLKNNEIFIKPRTETLEVKYTFYGQASEQGVENIQAIKKIKNGIAKTFNFFTWNETSLVSQDLTSVEKYGIRKKTINFDSFTDNTKRTNILNELKDEFYLPKQEFEVYTSFNYKTADLQLLDKVTVDYPAEYYQTNDPFPICGNSICGEAVLPIALWSFTVSTLEYFKIIGRSIDIKSGIIMFKLRGV